MVTEIFFDDRWFAMDEKYHARMLDEILFRAGDWCNPRPHKELSDRAWSKLSFELRIGLRSGDRTTLHEAFTDTFIGGAIWQAVTSEADTFEEAWAKVVEGKVFKAFLDEPALVQVKAAAAWEWEATKDFSEAFLALHGQVFETEFRAMPDNPCAAFVIACEQIGISEGWLVKNNGSWIKAALGFNRKRHYRKAKSEGLALPTPLIAA